MMSNLDVSTVQINGSAAPEVKINLTTIKRSDQLARRILSTTSHVEVYQFDHLLRTWERTTTEGSLFIYTRAEIPQFGFVVLNRLNSGNILQFVYPKMEFKVKDSFVMYKSSNDVYCGLHFDDNNECNRVGDILTSLSSGKSPIRDDGADQGNVVQMLEKAFHQSSSIDEQKQKAIELRKESPRRSSDPTVTLQPRKSGGRQQRISKSTKKETGAQSPSKNNTSTKVQDLPVKANSEKVPIHNSGHANAQNLKRQLFKSPECTNSKDISQGTENLTMLSSSLPHASLQMLSLAEVEEKLHGSVTTATGSIQSSTIQNTLQSHLINPSSFAVPAASASLPNFKSAENVVKSASLDVQPLHHSFSQTMLADELSSSSQVLLAPSHFPPVPPVMVSPGMRSSPVPSTSSPGLTMRHITSPPNTVQAPSLAVEQKQQSTTAEGKPLPPSSYQTPNRNTSAAKELSVPKSQSGLLSSPMVFQDNPTAADKHFPLLNKEQFIQAMLYMIQNDRDFSERLYLAYQQSSSDSLP